MDPESSEALDLLFGIPRSAPRQPTLRRGRPASFLLLSPAPDGRIDLESARLGSVFIDGVEVRRDSR
jgi:hypothetical protein